MTEQKYEELLKELKKYDKLAIAYSGGVDSTLLIKAAYDALGKNAVAMTLHSPFVHENETAEAAHIANFIGIEQVSLTFNPFEFADIVANPKDRCYYCKNAMFMLLLEEADKRGISKVAEGTNKDDTKDYRPGIKALEELEILSPLLKVNLSKNEIRELAKTLNLPNWNKPAAACLASRIPYSDEITKEALEKIARAEIILSSFGFMNARVRLHKTVARIEILENDFEHFLKNRQRILYSLKSLEFPYIALDLEGYRKGSLNKVR